MKQVISEFPNVPRLVLDAGNFSWLNSEIGRIKTRYLLKGMNLLKVEVANLGWNELRGDLAYLQQMEKEANFPFISANILQPDSSTPLVRSSIIKEFSLQPHGNTPRSEVKVGILGLCADTKRYNLNPSLLPKANITPAKEAIAQALSNLRKECHLIILLASFPLEEARQLCRNNEGIDIVLGGFDGIATSSPLREGNTIICYSGKDGEMIGDLKLFFDDNLKISSYHSRLVPLEKSVGEDPRMIELMKAADKEVSEFIKKANIPSIKKGKIK